MNGRQIAGANAQTPESITFNVMGLDESLNAWAVKEGMTGMPTHEEIREEIINTLNPSIINYKDLNNYDLKDSGLYLEPNKILNCVEIRGYSQGDYARVIYSPDDCLKVWGSEAKQNELKEIFTHLFYNAPVYAQITINGDEFNIWDMPEYKEYEWQRDEFIACQGIRNRAGNYRAAGPQRFRLLNL